MNWGAARSRRIEIAKQLVVAALLGAALGASALFVPSLLQGDLSAVRRCLTGDFTLLLAGFGVAAALPTAALIEAFGAFDSRSLVLTSLCMLPVC